MKSICMIFIVLSAVCVARADDGQEQERLPPDQIRAMEERIKTVRDPAARLFFEANVHRAKGEQEEALKKLAAVTALYPHEKRWITRSELLSAQLYLELGMLEAAEVTARQVEFMNKGTEAADQARAFREKIKQMKEQSE